MKVKGGVTQTQVVEGSISEAELLALVRETIHIPEGAAARFYTENNMGYGLLMQQSAQGISPVAQRIDVSHNHPLKFRITWEVPVAEKQG